VQQSVGGMHSERVALPVRTFCMHLTKRRVATHEVGHETGH